MTSTSASPAGRAAAAEHAVVRHHVRPLWHAPGTALGAIAWPPTRSEAWFGHWHYWWQAHLLDCLVDARARQPDPLRRRRVSAVARSVFLRNGLRWTNAYFDDMAWLGLALDRADRLAFPGRRRYRRPVLRLTGQLLAAWSDAEGGGVPWRRGDEFKNTPANGPAAILLARTGNLSRAAATADWIDERLRDPDTGLIWDGLRPGLVERIVYTYGQGVTLGAAVELAVRLPSRRAEFTDRAAALVDAVATHLTRDGVLRNPPEQLGGDPGLFPGILARYLALTAGALPGSDPAAAEARATAADLVRRSADAAWREAAWVDGRPRFGPDWTAPGPGSGPADRDLAVQLSAWMLLEAAATL
ncbi:glycoside hydrolase family 76 protein [Nakamurella leprariae]|uniref:Fructose-bisphosphate aldolase n=1 Tax=Nakamurella leprariae TaxID=2803911 RepID=A0A938Y6J9_9ACTN|nr:glycoside hydrolase family 76 protein [Nakamurella leprariae]MBM9466966.1 fructose-bisphosphate aldolase [Nakamurella leprariae]